VSASKGQGPPRLLPVRTEITLEAKTPKDLHNAQKEKSLLRQGQKGAKTEKKRVRNEAGTRRTSLWFLDEPNMGRSLKRSMKNKKKDREIGKKPKDARKAI